MLSVGGFESTTQGEVNDRGVGAGHSSSESMEAEPLTPSIDAAAAVAALAMDDGGFEGGGEVRLLPLTS